MLISLLPPMQLTHAAETTQRYELDTDGIDPGATYLIVNTATAGSANALMFYYGGTWSRDFRNQTLTIMLTEQLCNETEKNKEKFAIMLEDTAVVISPLIPWSIAGAVPLASIGAPTESILFAFFLYLLPILRILHSIVFKKKTK